jgi:hypothetical protein
MLFYGLGLNPVWGECKKAAGQLVLVNLDTAAVLAKLGGKDNLGEAIDKQLSSEEEGCGCEGGEGESEGCGD